MGAIFTMVDVAVDRLIRRSRISPLPSLPLALIAVLSLLAVAFLSLALAIGSFSSPRRLHLING